MDPLQPNDPRSVGPYRLEGRLGSGGMGQVFLGFSPGGRKVAVKVIHAEHSSDPQFRARFRREVEAARRVGGFHTAQVVDADPDAESPWLVTAFIPGPSLHRVIAERGNLEPDEIRSLGAGLAEGLAAIHACGLIHRDLKPGNVIMADDGPRIIDFGVAQVAGASALTSHGVAIGTFAFMSPEQIRGGQITPASDVFALGCVLACAAAGRSPFDADTIPGVVHRILSEEPRLENLPVDLHAVVSACLAKNPAARPSVANVLIRLTSGPEAPLSEVAMDEAAGNTAATALSPTAIRRAVASEALPLEVPAAQGHPAGPTALRPAPDRHDLRPHGSPPPVSLGKSRKGLRIGITVASVALLGICGGSGFAWYKNAQNRVANALPTPGVSNTGRGDCVWFPQDVSVNPDLKDVGTPPTGKAPSTGTQTMTITTNLGEIVVEVDTAEAPCTARSMTYLAGKGFFDGTKCHRLTTEGIKVLQCGDPTGKGTGGAAYNMAEENLPDRIDFAENYPIGTIAMAKTQAPNSTGSQFFIAWGDTPLPGDYTVLGKITEGLELLQKAAKAGAKDPDTGAAATDGIPKTEVTIETLTITAPENG